MRTDIERALDELASQEEGMRFQGLAVVLGKKRWPELIARQRKKDSGLDAYASGSLTPERIGKGLAASITATLKKVSGDASTAKENFPDLKMLLFVTSAKVGNAKRKWWEEEIQREHGIELHLIEREEVITQLMTPENASLCASFLYLGADVKPEITDLIRKTRRAAAAANRAWADKTKGHPLMELWASRLDPDGAESADVLSLEQVDQALSQSRRIVLEGPAGIGKTTTLIQLSQRSRSAGTPFIIDLPAWASSQERVLEYIAGMPTFQAESLTAADLAQVLFTEPFLFLLNGWNEIAEVNSVVVGDTLRELERDFPSAGIIVATRTHHLTPPLPGAIRLRLLRLRRVQRAAYLTARLGEKGTELRTRLDADPSLDELTRTPFILSEVASLFESSFNIPSTKMGVLAQVLRLHELRDEHRNNLNVEPIFGRQTEYLTKLAVEMTRLGSVALPDTVARTVVASVARNLLENGQIGPVVAPAILAALTAHHVLERVDYPHATFRFAHQQLQEYYAASELRRQLLDLQDDDTSRLFTSYFVNNPAWSEPLRMIAQTFTDKTGDAETDKRNVRAGAKLVKMALAVDPIFAGELSQLCGEAVWNDVRATVVERLRAIYSIPYGSFRQYAIAAMLATGADDFRDIILPLLSGQDQQTRLQTYRLWPDIRVSSIGTNWREQVRRWDEEARVDFVSELLHHRIDEEIADFASEDTSAAVKEAAVSGLMWTGFEEALTRVLKSVDAQTYEKIARKDFDRMPAVFRPDSIATMQKFIESTTDHPARLRAALDLVELGETNLDDVIKHAMSTLADSDIHSLCSHYIRPALEHLRKTDPVWVSEWVTTKVAKGVLYRHEEWLPFASSIPKRTVEECLQRLETEEIKNRYFGDLVAIIAGQADAILAARVFNKIRELRRKVDAESSVRHEFEWQVIRQLEVVFHNLSGDVLATGVLSSVTSGNKLDIRVTTDLLSRVGRLDVEPLRIVDNNLKARLRAYLKNSADLVLAQDDFSGKEKANLASSIAQVGQPEDMADLMTLIRADIDRMRRGRAARASGDRGPLSNGGFMSYARWHIAALQILDPPGAEDVLIELLSEPEYLSDSAAAMAHDFEQKSENSFDRSFRYDLMWAARDGRVPNIGDDHRRKKFAAALNTQIMRLKEQNQEGKAVASLRELAKALAAVDGRGSAVAVLDVIALDGQHDLYFRLDTAERLMMAGVILPPNITFALVDSFLARAERWMQDSDRYLLCRILALCPFIDDPTAGIARIRDVLGKRPLGGYELRELVKALGESRTSAAVDYLYELAADARAYEHCSDYFINALAALDTPRAREILLGFVDPDIRGIELTRQMHGEGILVERLSELARRSPEVAARLQWLCEHDLPDLHRHVLSKVMDRLGTIEAFVANLNLIDDARSLPIPQGVWDQLKMAFVERRPYGQDPHVYTQHARASNELRVMLYKMALDDKKREKSAGRLLGQIEEWRLEYGRPTDEPRHPDLASGTSWPP